MDRKCYRLKKIEIPFIDLRQGDLFQVNNEPQLYMKEDQDNCSPISIIKTADHEVRLIKTIPIFKGDEDECSG